VFFDYRNCATRADPMTRLIQRTVLMAALATATPASAQAVPPGPVMVVPPLRETMPGGTVVLRGSPAALNVNPRAIERSGKEATNYSQAVTLPPGAGWNHRYDTAGIDSSYDPTGLDQRTDRNYDAFGFDHRFETNGLTR